MALDTRNKRAGAIGVSLPWRGKLPAPDGAVGQGDRYQVGLHYPFEVLPFLAFTLSDTLAVTFADLAKLYAPTVRDRTMIVPSESRAMIVPSEDRTIIVPAEPRSLK